MDLLTVCSVVLYLVVIILSILDKGPFKDPGPEKFGVFGRVMMGVCLTGFFGVIFWVLGPIVIFISDVALKPFRYIF